MKFSIEQANPASPMRLMIYGLEGVGKSTLIGRAPNPVAISPEGGMDRIKDRNGNPIKIIKGVDNFNDMKDAVRWLTETPHEYQTLGVDSADWTEKLAHGQIIGDSELDIIRVNNGYGAGYRDSENLHRELIKLLSTLSEKRKMHIVVTAHAEVKQVKDPEMMHDYDSYKPKCHDFVASLWREWVDALLFVRFRTFTQDNEAKGKKKTDRARALTDGSRVAYTVHQPAFQAKNRYDLPSEMDFTLDFWDVVESYWKKSKGGSTSSEDTLGAVKAEIMKRVSAIPKDDTETLDAVTKYIASAGDDMSKLLIARKRLRQMQGAAA